MRRYVAAYVSDVLHVTAAEFNIDFFLITVVFTLYFVRSK